MPKKKKRNKSAPGASASAAPSVPAIDSESRGLNTEFAPEIFAVARKVAIGSEDLKTCEMCNRVALYPISGLCLSCAASVMGSPSSNLQRTGHMIRFQQCEWLLLDPDSLYQQPPPSWADVLAREDMNEQPVHIWDGEDFGLAHMCCAALRPDVLRLVLAKWPSSANQRSGKSGEYPLHMPHSSEDRQDALKRCVDMLLEFKADMNATVKACSRRLRILTLHAADCKRRHTALHGYPP